MGWVDKSFKDSSGVYFNYFGIKSFGDIIYVTRNEPHNTTDRIFKSVDGGENWTVVYRLNNAAFDIDGWDDQHLFAGVWPSEIVSTQDGGNNWVEHWAGQPPQLIIAAAVVPNSTIGYVCGYGEPANDYSAAVVKTVDRGASFFKVHQVDNNVRYLDIAVLDENTVFVCGDTFSPLNGIIRKSTNGGQTFTQVHTEIGNPLYGIDIRPSGIGFCVGERNSVLKTTDAGNTWTPKPTGGPAARYNAVFMISDTEAIICSSGGEIFRTKDGGDSWISESTGTTKELGVIDYPWVGGYGVLLKFQEVIPPDEPPPSDDELTVETILHRVQDIMNDETGTHISLEDICAWIDEAQNDLALRLPAGLIPRLHTSFEQTIDGNKTSLQLPSDYLRNLSLIANDKFSVYPTFAEEETALRQKLSLVTSSWYKNAYFIYRGFTSTPYPSRFVQLIHNEVNKAETAVMRFVYVKKPRKCTGDPNATVEIGGQFEHLIFLFCVHKAYLREQNAVIAQTIYEIYESTINRYNAIHAETASAEKSDSIKESFLSEVKIRR